MATKTTKSRKSTPAEPEAIEEMEEIESPSVADDPEEFITFKRTHFYSVLVVLAFAVGLLLGYVLWGGKAAVAATTTVAANQGPVYIEVTPQPTATPLPVVYDIDTDGFPSLGPADAPITIVEFSDYQCPYCWRWHVQVYDALMKAYPDQIRFVYRNFPLSFHQNAMAGAEAALCAGDQNVYWEYHDLLFDNQESMNNQAGTVLEQSFYNDLAASLNLDVPAFEECMTSHKYQGNIQADMEYAASLPYDSTGEPAVGGTPTFFINGHRLGGAYPIEYFAQIIDAELANQ
ncbi:MAG: DsbA family protein [Anaerolineales bacterium]|nr:DsbA family protein [Anaerolineales bacterium]MCB9109796.1 DsbA family protein [Anaerolineales bacterium]MCB9722384.1 DsbA family protein [Candidatus Omnitrophota bacterium]